MVKKSLFNFKSKKRRKKKKENPSIFLNIKKSFLEKYVKIKNKSKKFISKVRKEHKDKISAIKKFFLIITGYGFIINYALHFLPFGLKFNLFTLFAWGIAYYFISDEFVEWFRRLIAKR